MAGINRWLRILKLLPSPERRGVSDGNYVDVTHMTYACTDQLPTPASLSSEAVTDHVVSLEGKFCEMEISATLPDVAWTT
jgi:hypothetical protein